MKKNICIVGCGRIGRRHARNLARSCNLTFHSRSVWSAKRLNWEMDGKGVFDRVETLLAASEVDAVVICTPPQFHCRQVCRALRAGKSVLVEKPLCISPHEIGQIGKALEEARGSVFLMVAENYYYKPSLQLIGRLIDQGQLGRIQAVSVKKVFRQATNGWRSQYGALLEGGIHYVALISDIFDEAPVKVEAHFAGAQYGSIERHASLSLAYQNGAGARLTYAWNGRSPAKGVFQHSSIVGSEGKAVFESNGLYVLLKSGRGPAVYAPGLADLMGYKAMTRDFLACLDDRGRTPYSDFYKAKRDLAIIFQAYKAKGAANEIL